MRLYKGYFNNEETVFTLVRPAESKPHFYALYGGYGEIIKIEEVTEEQPNVDRSTKKSQAKVQQKGN